MLKVDLGLTVVAATRESVLALHESINMPLVSIPNVGTAPTQAFVLGLRNDTGSYSVMVVLRQNDNDANLVYVSDPRMLNAEQYRYEEAEGLRFVESMGFLMNDHGFRALAPERQRELLERTPIFAGARVERTVDLVELEEEAAVPDAFSPDAIFGGLENVPMLKGQPESPPSFVPGARAGAATQRPTMPAAVVAAAPRGGPGASTVPTQRPAAIPGTPVAGPPGPFGGPASPANPAAGLFGGPAPAGPAPAFPGAAAFGGPPPAAAPPPQPALSASALARLGRFLSTFAVVIALGATSVRCAHQPASDEPLDPAVQTKLDIAEHYLADGAWHDAVSAYELVIAEAPQSAIAHHGLGLAYMYLDRVELAEASIAKAIELDPQYSTAKNSLATLYLRGSRCADAERLLNDVIRDIMYPTPEFAQDNLARAEHCLGKSAEALARLGKLVLSKPQFCRGYLTMADIAAESRNPSAAIKACDDFTNRCELHEQIGKLVSPENKALCYYRKGMAQAALGDVDAARESLSRCDSTGTFGQQCKASLELLERSSWEHDENE